MTDLEEPDYKAILGTEEQYQKVMTQAQELEADAQSRADELEQGE